MTLMVVQHRRFPRSMILRVKQAIANVGGNHENTFIVGIRIFGREEITEAARRRSIGDSDQRFAVGESYFDLVARHRT